MLIKPINVADELHKLQQNSPEILEQVLSILRTSEDKDKDVNERLKSGKIVSSEEIQLEHIEADKIFSLSSIEATCIKYRLRFLNSNHFKSEIPYSAIQAINEFEKKNQVKVQQFKIMAPYGMFHLTDKNEDPLLFAQLNNNQFYLLHQWGNDLSWFRSLLYYPIQSIYTYFTSVICFAALIAWGIPFEWLQVQKESEMLFRFWLNTHFTIAFFFFFLFLGSLSNAGFSDSSWKSKHYN